MKKWIVFLITVCLLLSGCQSSFSEIDTSQIESVVVWSQENEDYQLNDEEILEIAELYNASQYGGKATGEGGTPIFGAYVHLKDGDEMFINQFAPGMMEVSFQSGTFYLKSEELYQKIEELSNIEN